MTGFTQITVVPPLDFTNEQLVVGDTSAHVSKMNSYMTKIQLWANDFAASIESMNALGGELASAETSNTVAITTLQNEIAEKLDSANTALNQMSEIAEAIVSLQSSFSSLEIDDVSDLSNQLNAANQEILSEATTRASAILAEATSRAYAINLEKVARENADGIESDARIEADNALSARLQIIEDIEQLDEGAVSQALADVNALLAQLGPSPSIQNVAGLQEALDAKVTRASLNLDAIALSKDYELVCNPFIYDTKNDSDGGAWRFKTHGTSWFNETLNTATRGARRDFPSVAVIILEAAKLTILDGGSPELDMWIVFNASANNLVKTGSAGALSGVSASNGKIITIDRAGYSGNCIDFILDAEDPKSSPRNAKYNGSIATRNNGLSSVLGSKLVINSNCNSVAMTVLPDAPIDHATGLQVPTIAVGTDGGVSILNGPAGVGTVVDWTRSTHGVASSVQFRDSDNALCVAFDTDDRGRLRHVLHEIPESDLFDTNGYRLGQSDEFYPHEYSTAHLGASLSLSDGSSFNSNGLIGTANGGIADASNSQLTLIHPNPSDPTKGMKCAITSTYNTGWQVGYDNKLTALCSTDDSDLVGSGELVTNGGFATGDFTGFTTSVTGTGSSADASSNAAVLIAVDASNNALFRLTLSGRTIGESLVLSFDVSGTNGYVYSANIKEVSFNCAAGNHTLTITPTSSTVILTFYIAGNSGTTTYDNISVQLADHDRSVRNNGLIPQGTINRYTLNPDSEIVFHKGMSAANHFTQAFNADLDFGTGDFSISSWVDFSSTGYSGIFQRTSNRAGATQGLSLWFYDAAVGFSLSGVSCISSYRPDSLALVTAVRKDGVGYLYFNDELVASISMTGSATFSDATTLVGGFYQSEAVIAKPGFGIALLRVSNTALLESQIKKMHQDELAMINGKATLYGTSDAVNAIAHDKVTGLLHVGTSDGRSSFDGLARVDNTTAAVSVISAHNSLILEG